jgi:hypothetical protein
MSDGGLVLPVAGRNAGCTDGIFVRTAAGIGPANLHSDPLPDGGKEFRAGPFSAAITDTSCGHHGLPDFEGGFEWLVTAGRSRAAVPEASAWPGVSARMIASLGGERRK